MVRWNFTGYIDGDNLPDNVSLRSATISGHGMTVDLFDEISVLLEVVASHPEPDDVVSKLRSFMVNL